MHDSPIEEIKNKLDIVDVIREYVNLEKAGSNYRALCPFHFEKTPSFFVNQSRQIWRCFGGCNEGGDMFRFVMRIEGVEFGDALRILAKKAGVKLQKKSPEVETKRKRLFDICEITTKFYESQLEKSKGGERVKDYLKRRNISEESTKKWRIGYAPTAKDALSKFLIGEGYERSEIIEAGVSSGKDNYSFDRFRGRIIFPIFNLSGSPVGFGGRVLVKEDKRAKYINTPATILYDKSFLLYGISKAKIDIRRRGFAIIVEGYTDVILCHQAGYENVVSSSGTALTPKQLDVLGRYTKKMLTAFDMDDAGKSATKKGIDVALEKDFDVRVIMMPEEKDPADIVSKNPKEWEEYIENAQPVMDFYFKNAFSKYNPSDPKQKIQVAKELLPEIKKIKNSIERSHFISKLSDALKVNEESILEEFKKIKKEEGQFLRKEEPQKEKRKKTRKELLEEKIVSFCTIEKKLLEKINNEDTSLFREEVKNIISFLKEEKKSLSQDEENLLNYLALSPNPDTDINPIEEIEKCKKEIKKENIRKKLKKTEEMLKEAEKKGDEEEQEELIKKFRDYSNELQNL